MSTLTIAIKTFPDDVELSIHDLTSNGLKEIIMECDTLKERCEEKLLEDEEE